MKTQWIYDKIPENGEVIMLLPVINWERQMTSGQNDLHIQEYIIVVDYGDDAASFHRRFFVACTNNNNGFSGTREPYWYSTQYDLTRREAINMANRLAFGKYSKVII